MDEGGQAENKEDCANDNAAVLTLVEAAGDVANLTEEPASETRQDRQPCCRDQLRCRARPLMVAASDLGVVAGVVGSAVSDAFVDAAKEAPRNSPNSTIGSPTEMDVFPRGIGSERDRLYGV